MGSVLKLRRSYGLLAILWLSWSLPSSAEERPHVPGLDWERMVIRATGAGAPDLRAPNVAAARLGAERAARLDAMRNILETLRGVEITAGDAVGAVMGRDAEVKARVEGLLRSFHVVATRYFSDGGVEVDVEMSLLGGLTGALLPGGSEASTEPRAEESHTGVIIDASGLTLNRALAPRILDVNGSEIYGPRHVVRASALERGVVAYSLSMEEARGNLERLGENPLVMRAIEGRGSDVVVSEDDGKVLASRAPLLAQGRVTVVTRSSEGEKE